jgi:DNA-binding transcriptional LysR family regulator
MMRFEWLLDCVALAKHKNFTDAAKARYSTQPTLSKHIDSLEKDVGCALFDVSNGMVLLTPAGSLFLDYAQRLLDIYGEAKRKSVELSKRPPVRIASSVAFERIYQSMSQMEQRPFVFVDLDCDEKKKHAALKRGVIDVFYRWGGGALPIRSRQSCLEVTR